MKNTIITIDHSLKPKTKSIFSNWNKRKDFLNICDEYKDEFFQSMSKHKFQTAGIFYAEAHAFLSMCRLYNVDLIIESGMSKGNSTEIFLKNFKNSVITFEFDRKPHHDQVEKRLRTFKNLKDIHYCDSNIKIESVIKENKDKNIAIFIDGPKDVSAVRLADKCFKFKNVKLAGIHDIVNPITKTRSGYDFMKYFGDRHVLSTDEYEYYSIYGYMDNIIEDEEGAWIYNAAGVSELNLDKHAIKKRFPKGPGIGVAINHE